MGKTQETGNFPTFQRESVKIKHDLMQKSGGSCFVRMII
jgi:hypothetical protein